VREGAEGTKEVTERRRQALTAYRLPPGKHGIPPEQVVENQRWRLLGAAAEVLAERGYGRIRVADVCRRAGVSRETFYEHFEDLPDCLLAAFEMTADCVVDLASAACDREGKKVERLRRALDELLEFLADEPALAHLLGAEATAAVPAIAAARERLVQRLVTLGVKRRKVEGALALVSERLAAGDGDCLPSLAAQLAELVGGGPATDAVR
jgi:AcrR family transcriptional regulator